LNDFVVPNFIGVDIGCSVTDIPLSEKFEPEFKKLDFFIRKEIPSGFAVNKEMNFEEVGEIYNGMNNRSWENLNFENFCERVEGDYKKFEIDKRRILLAIGSLGGGNHFISINKDSNDNYFLVVHSGSRNYGKRNADYHQKKAMENKETIIGYLVNQEKDDYLADMSLAQLYASLNRRVILKRITHFLKVRYDENKIIESIHNYINFEDMIIRKGAISAKKDEKIVIPLSMADGILFCKGRGNDEWNCSAPHGAGRVMSRSSARQSITVHAFKKRMEEAGVWSSCIGKETLDESPQAYKDPSLIIESIRDTADIIDHWKEVYNFKANSSD